MGVGYITSEGGEYSLSFATHLSQNISFHRLARPLQNKMVSRQHYSASVGSLTEDELQSRVSAKRDDSVATNVASIQSDDLSQIFAEFSENYAQMPGANGLLKMVKARLDSVMTPDHDDDGQSHAGSESSAEFVDDDTVIVENGHHHTPGSDTGFIHVSLSVVRLHSKGVSLINEAY